MEYTRLWSDSLKVCQSSGVGIVPVPIRAGGYNKLGNGRKALQFGRFHFVIVPTF